MSLRAVVIPFDGAQAEGPGRNRRHRKRPGSFSSLPLANGGSMADEKKVIEDIAEILRAFAAEDSGGYPDDWPTCLFCDRPALDGHLTCGRASCSEGAARDLKHSLNKGE